MHTHTHDQTDVLNMSSGLSRNIASINYVESSFISSAKQNGLASQSTTANPRDTVI